MRRASLGLRLNRRTSLFECVATTFDEIDTSDRETFLKWGIWDSLFIDGKEVRTGPPPSYEKLRD